VVVKNAPAASESTKDVALIKESFSALLKISTTASAGKWSSSRESKILMRHLSQLFPKVKRN